MMNSTSINDQSGASILERHKLAIIALAFVLRLFWMSDMEFKGDEALTVQFVTHIFNSPYQPFTPVAEHSGIANSSGVFYLIRLISLGSSDPLWIGTSIAVANALAISLAVWLCRKSLSGLLTLLMCATSVNLVLGSRKIWVPDLIAVWVYLFIGLFVYSNSNSSRTANGCLLLSAVSIFLAGHMYLPGLCYSGLVAVSLSLWLLWHKKLHQLGYWLLGCLVGCLSWLPYSYRLLTHSPGSFAENPLIFQTLKESYKLISFWQALGSALTLTSPLGSERIYLLKHLPFTEGVSPLLLNSTLLMMSSLVILWTGLFLFSGVQLIREWKRAIEDPLVVVSLATLSGTLLALQVIKLGNHLHYWLGASPFAYYLISWCTTSSSSRPFFKWIRFSTWIGIGGSAIACFLFFLLIRQSGGLPGEYKTSYRVQLLENRVGTLK